MAHPRGIRWQREPHPCLMRGADLAHSGRNSPSAAGATGSALAEAPLSIDDESAARRRYCTTFLPLPPGRNSLLTTSPRALSRVSAIFYDRSPKSKVFADLGCREWPVGPREACDEFRDWVVGYFQERVRNVYGERDAQCVSQSPGIPIAAIRTSLPGLRSPRRCALIRRATIAYA